MRTARRLAPAAGDVTFGQAADAYLTIFRGAEQASGSQGGEGDGPRRRPLCSASGVASCPRGLLRNLLRVVSSATLRRHCGAFVSHDSHPVHRNCHTAGVGCRDKGKTTNLARATT